MAFSNLEKAILPDYPVQFIDAFIKHIDLITGIFQFIYSKKEGC